MKNVLLILAAASSFQAIAAEKYEIVQATTTIYLQGLRCVAWAGGMGAIEPRLVTLLSDDNTHSALPLLREQQATELKHKLVAKPGCDLATLDLVIEDAKQSFGHRYEAPLTVIKDSKASFINGNGQCVYIYRETAQVDIGRGVILESETGELRAATDCAK